MKSFLRNLKIVFAVFMVLSFALLSGLIIQERRSTAVLLTGSAENKDALQQRYRTAGKILSKDGVILAQTVDGERRYAEDPVVAQACLQIVGDYTHNMLNTVENEYQGVILGSERDVFSQLALDVLGRGLHGDDITLTLDSRIQKKALELLGDQRGSIVVQNYLTGEVLASVSTPTTAPANVVDWKDIPDTALFNRAIEGAFNPGSTFKIITASGWLKSPQFDPNLVVKCIRPQPLIQPDGVREIGSPESGYGEADLKKAFEVSSNYFFGTVGLKIGRDALVRMAENFHYNQPLTLGRLKVTEAKIATPTVTPALLSWLAIGQPQGNNILTVSPLQLCMTAGTVGANGLMMEPQLVEYITNPLGQRFSVRKDGALGQAVDGQVLKTVQSLMVNNVSNYYDGVSINDYAIGGKTGTIAVTGQERVNSLFVGYIVNGNCPYAISIVLQNTDDWALDLAHPLFQELIEVKP